MVEAGHQSIGIDHTQTVGHQGELQLVSYEPCTALIDFQLREKIEAGNLGDGELEKRAMALQALASYGLVQIEIPKNWNGEWRKGQSAPKMSVDVQALKTLPCLDGFEDLMASMGEIARNEDGTAREWLEIMVEVFEGLKATDLGYMGQKRAALDILKPDDPDIRNRRIGFFEKGDFVEKKYFYAILAQLPNQIEKSSLDFEAREKVYRRAYAMRQMERQGYIRVDDNSQRILVRLDSIRKSDIKENWKMPGVASSYGKIALHESGIRKQKAQFWFDVFDGLSVYEANDEWEVSSTEPKPLFVIPQDINITPESVATTPGLLSLCEVATIRLTAGYPTKEGFWADSGLDWDEFKLMDTIFRRGKGRRNPDSGKLEVWYPQRGAFGKITSEWMSDMGLSMRSEEGVIAYSSPTIFFPKVLPRWLENGWVRKGDFEVQAGGAGKLYRVENRPIRNRGQIMLESVGYILGVPYQECFASILQNGKYALIHREVDGVAKVEGILVLKTKEEAAALGAVSKPLRTDQSIVLSPEEFSQSVDFGKEILLLAENPQSFLKFSDTLSREYQVDLVNMPLKHQLLFARVAEQFGNQDGFWEYMSKHGKKGLDVFLLAADTLENAELVLEAGLVDGSGYAVENVSNIIRAMSRLHEGMGKPDFYVPGEKVMLEHLSEVVMRITSNIFFDAIGANGERIHKINTALYGLAQLVQDNISSRFVAGNENATHYAQWMNMSGSADTLASVVLLQAQKWSVDSKGMELATQIFEEKVDLLADSDMFALLDTATTYRILAHASIDTQKRNQIIGKMLAMHHPGKQLKLLWKMMGTVPEAEKAKYQEMVDVIMGVAEDEAAPDVKDFYKHFEYTDTDSFKAGLLERHRRLYSLLQTYGITLADKVRDLGSGIGSLVGYFKGQGFTDVRGMEMVSEYVLKARGILGNIIDEGTMTSLPETSEYQGVSAFIMENNVLAHEVGEEEKLKFFGHVFDRLKPGGIVMFDLGDVERPGRTREILEQGKAKLRALGVPEKLLDNWYVAINRAGDVLNVRGFQPESELRKLAERAGFEMIEVADISDWYEGKGFNNDPNNPDPRKLYILRKPMSQE